MNDINLVPQAVGHMIGLGATGIGLWFATANPFKE